MKVKTIDCPARKCHKVLNLSKSDDIETARSAYNKGMLVATFDKKKGIKPKEKEKNVD